LAERKNTFRHPPLLGYSKIHYQTTQSLIFSRRAYWSKGNRFERVYSKLRKQFRDDKKFAAELAHKMSIGAAELLAAKGRVTGKWIIRGDHPRGAYVYTFALHEEPMAGIRSRVDSITVFT
jgi:hypothetical protein